MLYLSSEDIMLIHSVAIDETGGSHGVRDRHALLLLEDLPKQRAFGKELYQSVFVKAAVYARSIIFSHPFIDGNKRTAMIAADVFLQLNGYSIAVLEGEVEHFAVSIIMKRLKLGAIAEWFKKNTKKLPKR